MEYIDRKIDKYLLEWKEERPHKPLLLRGARQVGKSSAVRHLAKTFQYFVEVNFERDRDVASIFSGNLKPNEIISRLSIIYNTPIIAGKTLLFFDEIQACPEALHSLWFFCEDLSELHVIAAGSLLEFALKNMESYGVGRVRSLFMYPLSFDEFLTAHGLNSWLEAKKKADTLNPIFDSLHEKLVEKFREFLLIGGMPEVVQSWVKHKDFKKCQKLQDDIIITYEDDFSKYRDKVDSALLKQVLHSVVRQIGSKFVYSSVNGEYHTEKVKSGLSLLRDAGLIVPVYHTASNGIPLGAEINEKFVKYIFLDSGLMLRIMSIEDVKGALAKTQEILTDLASNIVNKGSLTEMVAGLEFLKYDSPLKRKDLYYWQDLNRGRQAEVDYILVKDLKILPVEVKAGVSGSMKSLYRFFELKGIDKGVRTSLENFGKLEKVDIIPLYALSSLVGSP